MDTDAHAWCETERRYPRDLRLRRNKFRVKHRPAGKEARWERFEDGRWVEYGEVEALALCGVK